MAQYDLSQICRPRLPFSIFSILLMSQRGELTLNLFAPKPRPSADRLMAVVDQIHRREWLSQIKPLRT